MFIRKKVLVVEDNEINRLMLCEILSSQYTVLEAENGKAALEILEAHKEEISLILLDIVMPVMDGYTFLSIMKSDDSLSSIPVIVATQSDSESDEVSALSHGATDFVVKPYKPQVILHRVASIISLRENASMVNQLRYDRVTRLYNKEFFYQKMKEILLQNPDKEYDVICSDIENFKLINDIFGVAAGDQLLRIVADVYRERVGDYGICGRFHADQFVCLLEHHHYYGNETFIEATERINTIFNEKGTSNIVIKWGIYPIGRANPAHVERMCDRAFLAVQSIKGQYGKYYATYDDKLRSRLLKEQAITDSMEEALKKEQFVIYLQPKYRLSDNSLAGAEALVRWIHPEWGLQPPGEFIPLFEKNGFITKLDQFVWDKACGVIADWIEKGYPEIPLSVNVSRADVYRVNLEDILQQMVKKHGLTPAHLHLEITESAYTENPEQIIETVSRLRDQGFVIEMDDFGSGYSSLNMLNRMPLDILKLDMKFIQSETAKPVDQGILRFIMELARWMNLSVVAEGVETQEQLSRLREIGCDYVQGYYFGKPMPCDEFETLMKRQLSETCQDQGTKEVSHMVLAERMILVADEDAQYRNKVKKTFEDKYLVTEAADVDELMEQVTAYGSRIAAAIISLTMPMKGYGSLQEAFIRDGIEWNFPVVITAPPNESLEEKVLEAGADDFICKPHSQKSLLRRVWRSIGMNLSWERERALKNEAYRDFLTGLLNRRGLDMALESLKEEEAPWAVFILDLDNLKKINDTYGHTEGDWVLRRFGQILDSHVRGSDIIARYGGDEFIIIMKHMKTEANALKKGNEICDAVRKTYASERVHAACSIGIAVSKEDESAAEVIVRADQALYQAKCGNKGSCYIWKEQRKWKIN